MKIMKITVVVAMGLFATACAQQEEEIVVVTPEPVFDKYGDQIN